MAGMRTIEELLKMSPDEFEITVFGAEPQPNYNRILLSPVLSGEMKFAGHRAQRLELVRGTQHHAACRQAGHEDRPEDIAWLIQPMATWRFPMTVC